MTWVIALCEVEYRRGSSLGPEAAITHCHVLRQNLRHKSGLKLPLRTSVTSSVLHNLATSGHLVFSRTALSTCPTCSLHWIFGIQDVCPFDYQLHCQAPMAQALDDPSGQLVHRRRRLQATRIEVIITPPTPSIPSVVSRDDQWRQRACYERDFGHCLHVSPVPVESYRFDVLATRISPASPTIYHAH